VDRVCPLLGLQGDRRSAVDGVDAGHRCHSDDPPIPLDRQQQAQVCLTREHERCDRYLAHLGRTGALPGRYPNVDALVSTRMILAPEPAWRGLAGRARRARSGPFLAAGAGVIALGIGGAAVASGIIDGRLSPGVVAIGPSATPIPTPTSSPVPTSTPTERPSPTPTPTIAPTSTPAPTPVPTVAPTPTTPPPPPPPQETYVVQEGDTLGTIAAQFGTTVGALQSANGIEDPDTIVIGQVLVIP